MTLITDGNRVYEYDWLLTGERELFAHENGLFVVYDHGRNASISIDPIGMTPDEIQRAISAADQMLTNHPVNRAQRRKMH